jgi:hypothetical protein
MNEIFSMAFPSRGLHTISWFDIDPVRDESGIQTISFPDYLYGTVIDMHREYPSNLVVRLKTVEGSFEVKLIPDTAYIACIPDDIGTGSKVAIAVQRTNGNITARKVMLFSGETG